MLTLLTIRNLALVDELHWELGRGLIAVTGETGAGKSVIVGALKLVLGERAEKSLIRTGEENCLVEAVFEMSDSTEVDVILEQAGLPLCEEGQLVIRRVIGQKGNRQFINSGVATAALLKEVGAHLVDLHGPHDHQGLLAVERQLAMLDAFAEVDKELKDYRQAYQRWVEVKREWTQCRDAAQASDQELELLRHQLQEIDAAELKPAEEQEIQERYRRAANSARLVESAQLALRAFHGAGEASGLLTGLHELRRSLTDLQRLDGATLEFSSGFETAALELQEMEASLQDYLEELEIDPAEAAKLEARVDLFETLKRKYGASLAEVMEHRDRIAQRLDGVENRAERLAELEQAVNQASVQVHELGAKLGAKRRKAAPRLAKTVAAHLADLGFKQAAFDIRLEASKQAQADGLESVEFEFGPNPGEPLKPLRQVASSGEISRVMLALKSALADQDQTPLMVFDEIDANVGGEIARAVGEKMASLGATHQVVAITHFPQVAAVAGQHFLVQKEVNGARTYSKLHAIEGDARINELVRMLGGGGDEARALAERMLASSGK